MILLDVAVEPQIRAGNASPCPCDVESRKTFLPPESYCSCRSGRPRWGGSHEAYLGQGRIHWGCPQSANANQFAAEAARGLHVVWKFGVPVRVLGLPVHRQTTGKAMPGIRGKRVGCGHVGALFALCERQQFEGAEELQSLPWRPLALRRPGREFAAGQGGHASTTDGLVTAPSTVIECAGDR
jgi:hypothetical protein